MVGHGGSDGLHGYVPALDYVVADTVSLAANFPFYDKSWNFIKLSMIIPSSQYLGFSV